MKYFRQLDYNQKLGYCTDTIAQSGCFLCSLSMLADIDPLEANEKLKQKGYVNGCLIVDSLAGESLGLEYNGNSNDQPNYPTIAETDYYKNLGVPQHFFVIFPDGIINDPLGGERVTNKYNVTKYHLFKGKDEMTTEQAKMLIYKATRGREAEGGERAWALGPISVDELAEIRFKDDVISSIWRGGLGTSCPESEKTHWSNTAKGTPNFNPNDLSQQWYNEHVAVECERCSSLQTELGHQLTLTSQSKDDLKVCRKEKSESDLAKENAKNEMYNIKELYTELLSDDNTKIESLMSRIKELEDSVKCDISGRKTTDLINDLWRRFTDFFISIFTNIYKK